MKMKIQNIAMFAYGYAVSGKKEKTNMSMNNFLTANYIKLIVDSFIHLYIFKVRYHSHVEVPCNTSASSQYSSGQLAKHSVEVQE